ncbi:hypothetical protein [Anabaena catenula]|uniref:Secreted protein n=1 Tax=Anabaena catenula FACHB-362 TaxID=2692877 RepID=A0ABR8J7D4_9NOST|nr:hypothetical protein [Anabaena catenula]MBD2693495.1 hypothetical protein [Anabaena catenula FACHB-362]
MNRKFILALLSSPVLFTSMLSMVMMGRPVHASQTVTPVGTHLSCVRSPHSANVRQVCIQADDVTPTTVKPDMKLAQVQPAQNQSDELEFTDAESNEAIKLFGCDCLVCLNAVRQLHGVAPLPV